MGEEVRAVLGTYQSLYEVLFMRKLIKIGSFLCNCDYNGPVRPTAAAASSCGATAQLGPRPSHF